MDRPPDAPPPDPSAFYRLNEELAAELARLVEAGHLDRLRALLEQADQELWVTSARPAAGLEELVGILRGPGGWDSASVLAARSRFTVTLPDGTPREVYMPDHICPGCWNEAGNVLRSCARECAACSFRW